MELQKVVVDKIKLELIAIPQVSSVSSLSSVSSPASVNLSRGRLSLWMEFQVSTEKKNQFAIAEINCLQNVYHKFVDISKWIEHQDVLV